MSEILNLNNAVEALKTVVVEKAVVASLTLAIALGGVAVVEAEPAAAAKPGGVSVEKPTGGVSAGHKIPGRRHPGGISSTKTPNGSGGVPAGH